MEIQFIASVAMVTTDPTASRALFIDALGLPLHQVGGDYYASDDIQGCTHFGLWPLSEAAEACFGTATWPAELVVPQLSIEFELATAEAILPAVQELEARGHALLHGARLEPWGQTVARLLSPEGAIVGLSFAPWMHDSN